MAVKLKKLKEQVIVITGASSGIGLCTAGSAGKAGAKVVLAARSGPTASTRKRPLSVSRVIIQAAPTACTSPPKFDTSVAVHKVRKAVCRNG